MPERGFDTSFWGLPFVQDLPADGKLLFAYLKTNVHCNQAGVYTITPSTMSFETGISTERLSALFSFLEPEVVWYPENNIVWVKSFLQEQAKSSKFIASALNIITSGKLPEELADDFQEYNIKVLSKVTTDLPLGLTKRECVAIRDKYTCQYCHKLISEPADYEMDHITPKIRGGKDNYLNLVTSCRSCNQKKLDKTPAEADLPIPHTTSFHAAQAIFLLKNTPELKAGFLKLFPEKRSLLELTLINVEQHSLILSQDTPFARAANANAASVSSSISGSLSEKGGGEGVGKGENKVNFVDLYENLAGRPITPIEVEQLKSLESDFTAEWLAAAIDEAESSGGRRVRYIEAILVRWKKEGFKSSLGSGAPGAVRRSGARSREAPAWLLKGAKKE